MFPCFVQDELNAELEGLEQEVLDERLSGADRVPVTSPVSKAAAGRPHSLLERSPGSHIIPSARESCNSGGRRRRRTTTTTSLPCNVDPHANYTLLPTLPDLVILPNLPSSPT